MKIKQIACALLLAFGLTANAANTITKVNQVSTEVTLSENVDYVITSATPFTGEGKVNITNTEHAVLIIQSIRPSIVISDHLKGRIFINGAQAVNGQNCQVKMYAQGAIIMPYDKNIKPLTVYSEKNFEGTAVNNFGLEHSGGFMNSLTDAKLNNKIRSFKLKRGYMVTFATGLNGWGYSRCFIADKEDLEFSELPTVLDGRISSYRVFQWYDAQKKGLASDTRERANSLLGTSWCYDWAAGFSHLPDRECIPHQIYVAWPSASACGSATYACHMKTNNEPGNSADDQPQSVETILNQWQELMRTGLRLCSESSHDGSWAHLDEFIAEVDRRGWRCDILDLHCYWSGGFDNMQYYYEKYGKRPIWISEFVWGASWNNNGIFATDRSFSTANQQKNLDAMKGILTSLNNSPYVERYAYWNSEADCSKLLRGESEMSLTGNYYRDMNSGMAYRKEYEKIPNVVYSAPSNVTGEWANQKAGIYKLSWEDTNFDLLNEIQIQRKSDEDDDYITVKTIKPADQNTKKMVYTYQDTLTTAGIYEYRVINVTAENKMLVSSTFKASRSSVMSSNTIHYGEMILVGLDGIKIAYDEDSPFSDDPAIFMGALTNNNSNLHLTNLVTLATKTGFTYTPNPWLSSAEVDMKEVEKIPFMSISEGTHQFGSLTSEVGTAKVRMSKEQAVTFTNPFPEGVVPVVLTEIYKPSIVKAPMVTKIWDITNTGFKCQIVSEEGATTSSSSYNVKYMAITPGVGIVDETKDLLIAAGRNNSSVYGTSNRANHFMLGEDTLRSLSPYIFTNLQTKNYDAATILRKQSNITETINGVKYTIGARIKRATDANKKTTSDGTKLNATSMKDDLGWVVLYTRDNETSVPTNIDIIEEGLSFPLRPYVVDGVIYVDGYATFDVYNTLGVKLNSHQPQQPGIYVVRTTNATAMVLVK